MMIKKINNVSKILLLLLLSFPITSCWKTNNNQGLEWNNEIDLKGDWKFSIGDDSTWSSPKLNDHDWEKIKVPAAWEDEGFHGYNGYAWYRKHVVIPAGIKNKGLYLQMGVIDDVDEVYVNGHLIGTTGSFPPFYESAYFNSRNYPLPDQYVNFGSDNVIAVRVYDYELSGGIISGDVGVFTMKDYILPNLPLEGLWKFNTGDSLGWKDTSFIDKAWQNIIVPGTWEAQGHRDYDGFAWYRKTFYLAKEYTGKKLVFEAGKIDDFDQVYLNGKLIGSMGNFHDIYNMQADQFTWQEFRGYFIPANVLKPGANNLIAIRVFDGGYTGGIYQGPIGIITQDKYAKYWKDRRK